MANATCKESEALWWVWSVDAPQNSSRGISCLYSSPDIWLDLLPPADTRNLCCHHTCRHKVCYRTTLLAHGTWKNSWVAFSVTLLTHSLHKCMCVSLLQTLEPGCSWRWEWHQGISGFPPSLVLGWTAAGPHPRCAPKTQTDTHTVIHESNWSFQSASSLWQQRNRKRFPYRFLWLIELMHILQVPVLYDTVTNMS